MSANNHHTSSGQFFPSLDGLRGLAVLSVVIYHTAYFNPSVPLQNLLYSFTKAGFMGVPIFFVLSGFLISYTIIKSQDRFSKSKYAARRAAKILPPFLISLVLFSTLVFFWKSPKHLIASALAYLSTAANFTTGWDDINGVYWSLMIEVHFYIVFPVLFFAFKKISKNPELWTALILFIVPVLIRSQTHLPATSDTTGWFHNANIFPKALDNFVLGVIFAHVASRKENWLSARFADVKEG